MFTGIIQSSSQVLKKSQAEGGYRLKLKRPEIFNELKKGESIAVNGICLSLEEYNEQSLDFFVGLETLSKTDFLTWKENHVVNLEQSLKLMDRVGGHVVSGHVDGTALVNSIEDFGEGVRLEILVKPEHAKWVVQKGSIAINGVSLTINEFDSENLMLSFFLIPETLKMTNLKKLSPGDFVNIECDSFVKVIVEKFKDLSL